MTNTVLNMLIAVLIVGALFPVAFSVLYSGKNDICFPAPEVMIPIAHADTLYFNTTNHRWYTVSSGYVTNVLYNQTLSDMTSPENFIGAVNSNHVFALDVVGNNVTSFTGRNVTEIGIYVAKRGTMTGNFKIGAFSSASTPVDKSVFGQVNTNTLNVYNESIGNFTLKTASKPTGYVIVAGDIMGIRQSNITATLENHGVHVAIGTESGVYSPNDNSGYQDTNSFIGYIKSSDLTNVYTIIPLTGNSPDQTEQGRIQCMDTFSLMTIIAIVSIIAVIIVLLSVIKGTRE